VKMKPTLPTHRIVSWAVRSSKMVQLTFNMRQESLILGELRDETFDSAANHGVLAHQDDRLPSKRMADFVHLLGADIVNRDDEDGFVLLKQALELLEVECFGPCFAPHDFFDMKLGYLRVHWVGGFGCCCGV
jgi:hypothetical protein